MESISKMIDQQSTVSDFTLLFRKQKFYVKMLAWLDSTTCNLNRTEAKIQSEHLAQYHKQFISNQAEIFASAVDTQSYNFSVRISQIIQKIVGKIQAKLDEIISPPVETVTPVPPSSLLRKRKRYIEMIDSLKPNENLTRNEAEVQSKHLDMFYRKFIANESEITALVEDGSSHDDLVEISSNVQQKVRKIQIILDEIISSSESVTSALSSLLRIRKYYIEMIDSLEPTTDDLNQTEAEVQSKHLDKFYEKFISNESEITALLLEEDPSHDQVGISHHVQQKVRKIQSKLNEIISPIKTMSTNIKPASTSSSVNDDEYSYPVKRPRLMVDFLDSQFKKQKYLMEQIELIELKNDLGATEAETLHSYLLQLHETFVENQSKIETYVSGPALDEQFRISGEILQKVMNLEIKLKDIFSPVMSLLKDISSSGGQLEATWFE